MLLTVAPQTVIAPAPSPTKGVKALPSIRKTSGIEVFVHRRAGTNEGCSQLLTAALLVLALVASFGVYVKNTSQVACYAIAIFCLIGVALNSRPARGRLANITASCMAVYVVVVTISIIRLLILRPDLADNVIAVGQYLMYPIVAGLVLCYAGSAFDKAQKALFLFAIIVGLTQAGVALSNTVFGPLTLPELGTLPLCRYIFFTSLHSSAGLFLEVNYYATSQLMLFWLAVGTRTSSEWPSRLTWCLCAMVLASTVLGSSRGAMAATITSVIAYWLAAHRLTKERLSAATLMCAATIAVIVFIEVPSEELADGLRFHRGLNNRDFIWKAASSVIMEYPALGVGVEFGELLHRYGSPTTAAQNTILASLLRGGVLGTVPWLIVAGSCMVQAAQRTDLAWATAAGMAWITDGMVRCYSLGGLGLIPLIVSLAFARIVWLAYSAPKPLRRLRKYQTKKDRTLISQQQTSGRRYGSGQTLSGVPAR